MKIFFITILCIFSFQISSIADTFDNGFYTIGYSKSSPTIITENNQKVKIGLKKTFKINEAYLFSANNQNEQFHLYIGTSYHKDRPWYIFLIDGKAYKQSSSGSSHKKTTSLSFNIPGKKQAEKIAKYFSIKPQYRKHPGYNLSVKFIPQKKSFNKNEEVWVTLQIKNIGKNTIAFQKGGRNRAVRDNQYRFVAEYNGKQVKDIGSNHHSGGMSIKRILKPGSDFTDKISLSKWFDFEKPGIYQILGSYYMAFFQSDNDSYRSIWEDYVSAEFIINIHEDKKKEGMDPKVTTLLSAIKDNGIDKRRDAAANLSIFLLKKNNVWRKELDNWKIPTEEGIRMEVKAVRTSKQKPDLALANMCAHCMGMIKSGSWRKAPIKKEDKIENKIIQLLKKNKDPIVKTILLVGLASSPTEKARDIIVKATGDNNLGVQKSAVYLIERCSSNYFGPIGNIHIGSPKNDVKKAGEKIRKIYKKDKMLQTRK
jgi:hypothetical protein